MSTVNSDKEVVDGMLRSFTIGQDDTEVTYYLNMPTS